MKGQRTHQDEVTFVRGIYERRPIEMQIYLSQSRKLVNPSPLALSGNIIKIWIIFVTVSVPED